MIDGYVAGYGAWNECHPDNPEYKIKAMSEKYCTVCGNPVYTASTIAAGRCQSCFEKDQSPQPVPAPKVGEEDPILTRLDIAVIKEKLINELASFRELVDHEGSNLEEAFEYGYIAAIRQSNHMLNIRGKDIPTTPETEQPGESEGGEVPEIEKMSDALAGMADIAAIEYGEANGQTVCREDFDYDNSADLTDAFIAGQSWMYRKMMEGFPQTENPQASYWFEKARQNLVDRNDFNGQLNNAQSTITALQQERDAFKDKWERAQKDIAALTEQIKAQ